MVYIDAPGIRGYFETINKVELNRLSAVRQMELAWLAWPDMWTALGTCLNIQ